MDEVGNEVIDSQIIAEQVGFLDNCFDNSSISQFSLVAVKEFVTEELSNIPALKSVGVQSNKKTIYKNTSLSQPPKQNVINKNLKAWGLPNEITSKYEQKGITEMFDWQVSCLANSKVLLDCSNLVYSAPTSAGKTLVAEILTIKTILERQKKVIIILPFVSIVREKTFYLQEILSSSGIRVEGFMGSQSPPGGLQAVHVAICTIEKANSLVNRLLDEGSITELGAVIVDELHLLGDPHRGYILELLLTKIKYISRQSNDLHIQIVGMSATLPNLKVLAKWLCAELFVTQFRPIPLDEFCLVGNKMYDKDGKCVNTSNSKFSANDSDNVLNICLDTIKDGCSILLFCMTKNRCENLAQSLASSFYNLGCQECDYGSVLRKQLKTERISEVLEQLRCCPVGLDQVLMKTISFGVAYHHAGLTFDERDIIEGAFKSGAIRVLVATSTLSSGVNLPAQKVIIRSPVFLRQPINILTYKQMIGRAGRMGQDTKGESILMCTEAEKTIGFGLMMRVLDPVKSCIESEDKYMRAVLEMIASQNLCTKTDLDVYSRCTLLFTQQDVSPSQNKLMENTLNVLQNYELVRLQEDGDKVHYVATPLGKACLSASMAPNDGLSLFIELQKARQCLVLETDLHLIYLVTPYSVSSQWGEIDWLHLLTLWESLPKAMKKVGELVGIQESFIIRCLKGTNKMNHVQSKLNVHKRFYTALALQDLVNEVPLAEVASKFQCARGFLQSLQQAAATFAGMVTAFCRQLSWKNMEILVSQFQDRLHFGIHSDLLELMKLPSLNGVRARALFDSGFETLPSIASADTNVIENILHKAVPFQSDKEREGDDCDDVKQRKKMKSIWITGCCGMTAKEAAENLIAEARKYLENEIGVNDIKWSAVSTKSLTNQDSGHESKILECNQDLYQKEQNGFKHDVYQKEQDEINQDVYQKEQVEFNLKNVSIKIEEKEDEVQDIKENSNNNDSLLPQIEPGSILKNIFCKTEVKSEIVWDSLDFTETGIENLTKVQALDKIFSPNISFGDTDKSAASMDVVEKSVSLKSTIVKDTSLFSTDGDNSSFFDESLPLDLIPSKLFDGKKSPVAILKQETTEDFVNIEATSILDAFKSPLIDTDDDDIKLVYDDDGDNRDDKPCLNLPNESEEVVCSQVIINTVKDFKSPYKRRVVTNGHVEHNVKKKKFNESIAVKRNNFYISKFNITHSALTTVKINDYCFNCIILKENYIYENLHVLENMQAASVYLNIKKEFIKPNKIIGYNVLNIQSQLDTDEEHVVNGIAIYVGDQETCIYLDFTSLVDKMALEKKMLKCLFKNQTVLLKMFSLKLCYLYMKKWLDISLPFSCVDVSVAEWLIASAERIPNIEYLIKKYCGLDLQSNTPIIVGQKEERFKNVGSNIESCVMAWGVWMIAEKQKACLRDISQNVIDVENQVATILANSEHHGITVVRQLASKMLLDLKQALLILQKKANKLAGCYLNLNSPKAVAKALKLDKIGKVSTKKSVLTCHNSQLSSIVIYWRKLSCILSKILYPITEKTDAHNEGDRIHTSYTTLTCTGRISMHEPNLQNVPRTFSIPRTYLEDDSKLPKLTNPIESVEFNCRDIFIASPGYVLVSADYCQLEMRIMSHFSEDAVLQRIMHSGRDVFKSIASSWSNIPEDEVDDDLRQKAKQLCYGIIYGMGNKTLSQHLDVTELEAAFFMDSFYRTFPDVENFTRKVVEECRRQGYVETLMRRRRNLPQITSLAVSARSAAERQAVNTTIQGSAADIAKAAMCAIDNRTRTTSYKPRLLLQMHDELIYEVPEKNKQNFMKIMKEAMEGTIRLKVPLPVKVKSGYSWGSLKEVYV